MRSIIACVVVMGLVGAGITGWRRYDIAHARPGASARDFVRASRRDMSTQAKATGVIKPMVGAEVNVGSSVSGVVMRLLV